MLRGAAGVGAVGFAAAVGVGAVAAPALADTRRAAAGPAAAQPETAAGPLVIYLRDAASGEFDVFAGTSHTVIRDHDLVARLTSSAKRG
ncbi:MAG TPA: hypothetical protein VHZ33_16650 [Trebonia sp.]|nr:hypothetical protein [Trebonia sp.]